MNPSTLLSPLAQLFTKHKTSYNRAMPEGYITITEAAQLLGLKPQQIRNMIRAGMIPESDREKIGTTWIIKRETLMGLRPRKKGRPYGSRKGNATKD